MEVRFKKGDFVKIKSKKSMNWFMFNSHSSGESHDVNTEMTNQHGKVFEISSIIGGTRLGSQKFSLRGDSHVWYGYLVKRHTSNKLDW